MATDFQWYKLIKGYNITKDKKLFVFAFRIWFCGGLYGLFYAPYCVAFCVSQ